MMGALDGELTREEQREFDELLESEDTLRTDWHRMRTVKGLTDSMEFRTPSDAIWEGYMDSVYRRVERGVAWILVSVGATVLISTGLWQVGKAVFIDDQLPLYIKGSLLALFIGAAILMVSVAREKFFMHQRDPYKDVIR